MTEEEQFDAIWKALEEGKPLPDGVYVHVSETPTPADWDALDPNSWETFCGDCDQHYSGAFSDPTVATEMVCPSCGSSRTAGVSSPAGGMSLILRSDWS
jgi:hypothetical protein